MYNKQFEPKSYIYEITKNMYRITSDNRGYMILYEYRTENGDKFCWDGETGEVFMTKIWKALGYSKDAIRNAINKDLDLPIKKIRGGCLEIQGTWVPYDIAKTMCIKIAGTISHQLIPIFGYEIVDKCKKYNHSQNKHKKSDSVTGLSNIDVNKQFYESNTPNHINLEKRKRVHSLEIPSSSTSKIRLLNSSLDPSLIETSLLLSSTSSLSSFSVLSKTESLNKSISTYDYNKNNNNYDYGYFSDCTIYNDNYNYKNNDNNNGDVGLVPDYIYQNINNNSKSSNSTIPDFHIVPINLQQDTDATVPSYIGDNNNILHPYIFGNNYNEMHKNEKELQTNYEEIVKKTEASILLIALATDSQSLQQIIPETLIIDDKAFKIIWN